MKYRFKPTEQFWESFYDLSPDQKESTRRAWNIFKKTRLTRACELIESTGFQHNTAAQFTL